YNKNHYPGRPGHGTGMMAMPSFVKPYAESVAGAVAVAKAEAAGGDTGLDALLELANGNDEKSFRIAAWFLSTQCADSIQPGLVTRKIDGLHNHFRGKPIPPYAILSHRWSAFETLLEDISNGNYREKEEGYWKLRFCAEQAARDGLQYF
ncbi:hypothetical protein PtrSN001C_011374, partial [Pyrenophora tritici-repentis]